MTLISCSIRSLPVPSPRLAAARIASSTVRISLDSVTSFPRVLRCLRPRSLSPPSMAVVVGTERKKAVEVFNTEGALATSIAEHTAGLSETFVRARGAFSFVLSGGSLFKFLRFQYTQTMFMQINDAVSPEGIADDYEMRLTHLVKRGVVASSERSALPKFDLMLLGMGPRPAYSFALPRAPSVNEYKKWVTFINDSLKSPEGE